MNTLAYLKYNMLSRGYSTIDVTNTVNLLYNTAFKLIDKNLENIFISNGYKQIFEEFQDELYAISQFELINQHS